jgi:galactokinase
MDQAISIMGQPGTAKLVSFNPVTASDVALPPDAVFVVANSLAVSKKAETADIHYNLRVVECRVAAAALGRVLLGGDAADPATVLGLTTLKAVEPLIEGSPQFGPGVAGKLAAVAALLKEGAHDRAAVEAAIGMPLADLLCGAPAQLRAADAALGRPAAEGGGLFLRDRAAHVYAEADRVHAFRAVAAGEGGGDALAGLGRLMDASQASCRCVVVVVVF